MQRPHYIIFLAIIYQLAIHIHFVALIILKAVLLHRLLSLFPHCPSHNLVPLSKDVLWLYIWQGIITPSQIITMNR
jgi:hypothetical protein